MTGKELIGCGNVLAAFGAIFDTMSYHEPIGLFNDAAVIGLKEIANDYASRLWEFGEEVERGEEGGAS